MAFIWTNKRDNVDLVRADDINLLGHIAEQHDLDITQLKDTANEHLQLINGNISSITNQSNSIKALSNRVTNLETLPQRVTNTEKSIETLTQNINDVQGKSNLNEEEIVALKEKVYVLENGTYYELDEDSLYSDFVNASYEIENTNAYIYYSLQLDVGRESCHFIGKAKENNGVNGFRFFKSSTMEILTVWVTTQNEQSLEFTPVGGDFRNVIKAVLTENDMDYIIENATEDDIGSFYMYLGETTDSYKKGSVYRIGEV